MESVYFGQTGNVVKSNFLSVAVVILVDVCFKTDLTFCNGRYFFVVSKDSVFYLDCSFGSNRNRGTSLWKDLF